MKTLKTLLLVIAILASCTLNAQVAITTDGSSADGSAMLDVKSTDKGMLLPRMTTAQRDAITTPANSLLIFNTTTQCFEAYNATTTTWVAFGCLFTEAPTGVTATATPNPVCEGTTLTLTGDATGATGWSWTGPNGFTSSEQNPTITNIAAAGAGGYSLTASNSIGSVTASTVSVTVNPIPTPPTAGTHIPSETQIIWKWNTVSGATGYKWSATNDYSTATDMGVSTSKTETGLTGETAYTRYVWAYNDCGESTSLVLSKTTNAAFGDVTNSITGKTWMDRNLGASQVATSSIDVASYGDLYQWGRAADGHQIRTSTTTSTKATSSEPTTGTDWYGKFITTNSSPFDWLATQNGTLWQGVSGTNNPCPSGYRLPTQAEWTAERESWVSNNAAGAFASPLKLPLAGFRDNSQGALDHVNIGSNYWSSTVDDTFSWSLYFYDNRAGMDRYARSFGNSVRCLKD